MMSNLMILMNLDAKPRLIWGNGAYCSMPLACCIGVSIDATLRFTVGMIDAKQTFYVCARDGNGSVAMTDDPMEAWRGMHILDRLELVNDRRASVALLAGKLNLDRKNFEVVVKACSLTDMLQINLMRELIPDGDVDAMLGKCNNLVRNNMLSVPDYILEGELRAGFINQTTAVERAFEINRRYLEWYQAIEVRSWGPLSDEQSLKRFCINLGITRLGSRDYYRDSYGSSEGFEWIDIEKLDRKLVLNGLLGYGLGFFWMMDGDKATRQPVVQLNNDEIVALMEARYYEHGGVFLTTRTVSATRNEVRQWRLNDLTTREPRLIGVTLREDDVVDVEQARRGYKIITG